MRTLLSVIKSLLYFLGISVAIGSFLFALRKLLIRQFGIVQHWALARIRRRTSFAIGRALILREYGERLMSRADLRYLIVPGQDIQTSLPIESAFISLTFRETTQAPITSETFLASGAHRILVIGEPGSGKSSLLKREAFRQAQELRKRAKQGTVPVFLKLSAIAESLAGSHTSAQPPSVLDVTNSEALRNGPEELRDIWDDLLHDGRVSILLDGLDEVPLAHLTDTCLAIAQLCRSLDALNPKNLVVVSSRPQAVGLVPPAVLEALPVQLTLERFTSADIYEFLSRWPFPDNSTRASATEVFLSIADNPHLKQLCQTPLLLAMYAAIISHSADMFDLPSTREEFYSRALTELLVRRNRADLPPSKVRIHLWTRFAQEVAYVHLFESHDPRNQVSQSTINLAATRVESSAAKDQEFVQDFLVNTGLLREERYGETYYFMHLSLAEYLAAMRLAKAERDVAALSVLFLNSRIVSESKAPALTPSARAVLIFFSPQVRADERREHRHTKLARGRRGIASSTRRSC